MSRRARLGYLVGSIVCTALLIGFSWGLVYELAAKPLVRYWDTRISTLQALSPLDALWWRSFLAIGFDMLIIVIAVIGSWWVLAHFYIEARDAGKWWLYARSREARRDKWLPRLTAWQRFQHIWIMVTFAICAITGFSAWADLLGARQTLLRVHVASGLAMGAMALLHFAYYSVQVLAAKLRGESVAERFPIFEIYSRRFLRNLLEVLLLRKPRDYGKYDPEQLFEYWGVYWGMAVLGIPGVIMWLYGPHVLDGVFWVTHTKEAVLAVTFILMVHIAYSHFRPSVFPIDTTFITGRMPLRRAKEHHPRWAEKFERAGELGQS